MASINFSDDDSAVELINKLDDYIEKERERKMIGRTINSKLDNCGTLKEHIKEYKLGSDQEKLLIAFNYFCSLDHCHWGLSGDPNLLMQYISIDTKRIQAMKDEIMTIKDEIATILKDK